MQKCDSTSRLARNIHLGGDIWIQGLPLLNLRSDGLGYS